VVFYDLPLLETCFQAGNRWRAVHGITAIMQYVWSSLLTHVSLLLYYTHLFGNVADERVILFLAISSSDNLRLGIRLR